MIKRILVAVCSLLLTVAILWVLPVVITDPELEVPPTDTSSAEIPSATRPTAPPSVPNTGSTSTTRPTTPPNAPSTSTPPATEATPPATMPPTVEPSTTTPPPAPGQVRLYVCDTARLEVYRKLAAEYYHATGVEVILLTPQEGEACEEALARYMASDTQPTMFCIHQEQTLQQYAHLMYDLTDTQAAAQLYSSGFGMYYGEKLLALPVGVEWFGYIYNAKLLENAAFTRKDFYRTDITGYHTMSYIAQYLTSTGVSPFGKPDLTDASATGLLALLSTIFRDPDQLKSVVDLYVSNGQAAGDSLTAFKNGESVFYAGTTASFADVLSLGTDKVDLLPAFAKGSSAMQYTCASFWAVKGTGYDPDIQVTREFLRWMVSARTGGSAPIDDLGLLSPYKSATVANNALEKLLRKYMAQEPARLVWASGGLSEAEMKDFCAALAAYCADPSDAAWEKVAQLLEKKPATQPEA